MCISPHITDIDNVRSSVPPFGSYETGSVLQVEDDEILLKTFTRRRSPAEVFVVDRSLSPHLVHVKLVADLLQRVGLPDVEVWIGEREIKHLQNVKIGTLGQQLIVIENYSDPSSGNTFFKTIEKSGIVILSDFNVSTILVTLKRALHRLTDRKRDFDFL